MSTTPGVARGRLLAGLVVLPGLTVLAVVAVWLGARDRLPDPMATHWGIDGVPNGSMSPTAFLVTMLGLLALLWGLCVAGALSGRRAAVRFRIERLAMTAAMASTAFLAGLALLTIFVNVDEPNATGQLPALLVVPVLAVAALSGMVGWVLAGRPPVLAPAPVSLSSTTRTLGPGEQPVWHGHLASRGFVGLAAALTVTGVTLWWLVSWIVGAALLVGAVVTWFLSSVHVTVDATGLTVGFGPLGRPRRHVPRTQVSSAAVAMIEPLDWGGWGYRVMPGRSAVVLRRGPGIVVERTDGRRFAVTVDAPDEGAALLDAYARRG